MKKIYLMLFIITAVFLLSCVHATNDTSNDFKVSANKNKVKMGDTVELKATKKDSTSSVKFKVNNKTIKNYEKKSNIKMENNSARINYTIKDGTKAGKVNVEATTKIDNQTFTAYTSFDIVKMKAKFTNTTTTRSNEKVRIKSLLLDYNNHTIKNATVKLKVNNKTFKINNTVAVYNISNSKVNIRFNLSEKYSNKDVNITLESLENEAYLNAKKNVKLVYNKTTRFSLKKVKVKYIQDVIIPVNVKNSGNSYVKDGNATLYIDGKIFSTRKLVKGKTKFIIKNLTSGKYRAKIVYDSKNYKKSSNSTTITITNTYKTRKTRMASLFVRLYANVTAKNVTKWVKSGITDVFVQASRVENDTNNLKKIVHLCRKNNIKVHAWIICFCEDFKHFDISENKQNLIKNWISNVIRYDGVEGICLDYVRYSGTNPRIVNSNVITNFVKETNLLVKLYNKHIELSACVFPERGSNKYYYGQDYAAMSNHLDYIMPMAYKISYRQGRNWLKSVTSYVKNRSNKAKVVCILQTYTDENGLIFMNTEELKQDIKAIMQSGSYGYSLFRYGALSKYPKIF